ncbi:hypothetical protein jhhlp_002213 [Lomentospora prolificans]|uniref:Uncharacterized protein n=1 Tax=Lomentospora prolificans TaxID=41688 RepID=A0A2N3NDN0_9PEZI|nr:hypothetical protein jhhlp_002213 [Lomentospora prolificans]
MQAQLEVGRAARHPRMIVSPPRLNLRRAASYQHEKGPLSSTSSRFNFNHLFFSPPPSPSLPALISRPKKSPTRARPSRVLRIIAWILSAAFIIYIGTQAILKHIELAGVKLTYIERNSGDDEVEIVSGEGLPEFPTPVIVQDAWMRSRWTVSIPRKFGFPLSVSEYAEMPRFCREVQAAVRKQHEWTGKEQQPLAMYGQSDSYYIDVREAVKAGLLPGSHSETEEPEGKQGLEPGNFVGVNKDSYMPECEKSLTVVLETSEAGIGHTLMMMWTFYGIAKEQGRSFFIDDSRWTYGRYTSIFQPPPVPECRPPPRHEMVPCPQQARHLVVSAATARDALMDSLSTRKGNPAIADDGYARKVLYDFARRGYEALFHLISEDVEYVNSRVESLTSQAFKSKSPIAGMHIRRGDCHPLEFPYRDSYIPTDIFVDSARSAIKKRFPDPKSSDDPFLLVASDDPTVHNSPELTGAHHAQERIKLASKDAIDKSSSTADRDRSIMHRFKDEAFGWEGGFFSTMFWNLGLPKGQMGDHETKASGDTIALRAFLARAYLMDLSVLAKASDTVVCAVGTMGCRLLGVMMGWHEIAEGGKWVNIDGDHKWMGLTW